ARSPARWYGSKESLPCDQVKPTRPGWLSNRQTMLCVAPSHESRQTAVTPTPLCGPAEGRGQKTPIHSLSCQRRLPDPLGHRRLVDVTMGPGEAAACADEAAGRQV